MKDEKFKQKIKNKVGRPKKNNLLSIIKENKMEDENFKDDKKNKSSRKKIAISSPKNTNVSKVGRPKKTTSLPKIDNVFIKNFLKIRKVNKQEKSSEKNYINLKIYK